MMTKIYLAVRIYATIHLLYELWIYLFRCKAFGLWNKLYRWARIMRVIKWQCDKKLEAAGLERKKKHVKRESRRNIERPKVSSFSDCEVIGKTKSIYIPDPKKTKEPVRSEPLPKSDFIGEDEDISYDDVEYTVTDNGDLSSDLTDAEMQVLMAPVEIEPDLDFPTGIPISRISAAADVLMSGSDDMEKRMLTAETLFQLKDTDLFKMFAENICPQEELDMIIAECLTDEGERRMLNDNTPEISQTVNWDDYM